MTYDALIHRLAYGLATPLPGVAAHMRMAPRPRRFWKPGVVPPGLRDAAALLLVYASGSKATVVLTVRSTEVASHRGQVSLPGGALDGVESLEQAALREAHEEIGLDDPAVLVLGRLSPLHIPVSGFALHPVVAALARRPRLEPSPREVARIIEVPVDDLADPSRLLVETWRREEHSYRVPFFQVAGEKVWGATAMVLSEFLDLAGAPPDPWRGERDDED